MFKRKRQATVTSIAVSKRQKPTPAKPVHFLQSDFGKLPPELRNIIYGLVYGTSTTVPLHAARKSRNSKSLLKKLFVSRQWFTEALPIYLDQTELYFPTVTHAAHVISRLPQYAAKHVRSIAWHADSDCDGMKFLKARELQQISDKLPGLRKLRISIMDFCLFGHFTIPQLSTQRSTAAAKLLELRGIRELCHLRGLSYFTFDSDTPSLSHLRMWCNYPGSTTHELRDVAMSFINEFIRTEIMKPKEESLG